MTQPVLCLGKGGIHTECTWVSPDPPPKPRPTPTPVRPPPTFPQPVACSAGEQCWFELEPSANTPSSLPCSPAEHFRASTSTATNGYVVAYCNATPTGLVAIQEWITANPSFGAKLVSTAIDGLPAPLSGEEYLVYDHDPTLPVLPPVASCPAGATCDFDVMSGAEGEFASTLCALDYYMVNEVSATASSHTNVGYCNLAGAGASELAAWQASNPGSYTSTTSPGLPTAAAGYTWLTFDVSTGPVFPLPAVPAPCEAGYVCSFSGMDPLVLEALGCSMAYDFAKTLPDGSTDPNDDGVTGGMVALCPTSANIAGWSSTWSNASRQAYTTLTFEGLPTQTTASGFTYLVYGTPDVGITCSSCEGLLNGSGGGGTGGGGSSGGGTGGGGGKQD